MKSSPFRTIQGGVSKTEETTTKTKQPKKKSVGENIAEFMTPTNKLELALSGLGGVGTGTGKWGTKFLTKTKIGRKLANKIPFVANLLKKQDVVKNQGFKAFGTKGTKGGVAGGAKVDVKQMNKNIDRYGQPEPTLYSTPKTYDEFKKIRNNATRGQAEVGKSIAGNLKQTREVIKGLDPKKHVKKLGVTKGKNPRTIYEITYPDGQKIKYWESSGSAGKPVKYSERNKHLNAENSKGHFGVLPGNMDASVAGGSKSWYIKGDGWERGYGSELIEESGIWLKSLNDSKLLP